MRRKIWRERRRRSLKNLVNYIIKIQHFKELKEVIGVLDLASFKGKDIISI